MARFRADKEAIAKVREIQIALDGAISLAEDGAESGDIAIELNDVSAMLQDWLSSVKIILNE